jgi:hypothetical protein
LSPIAGRVTLTCTCGEGVRDADEKERSRWAITHDVSVVHGIPYTEYRRRRKRGYQIEKKDSDG